MGPSCFICEDGGDLWRICGCTDRWIHLECQRMMMHRTQTHRAGCPVCQMEYTNVALVRTRLRLHAEGKRMLLYSGGVTIVMGIGIYEAIMFSITYHPMYILIAVTFIVASSILAVVGQRTFADSPMLERRREVRVFKPSIPGGIPGVRSPRHAPPRRGHPSILARWSSRSARVADSPESSPRPPPIESREV